MNSNLTELENGLPCFTYMRSLPGAYRVYGFMHNFIKTYRTIGFSDEKIYGMCRAHILSFISNPGSPFIGQSGQDAYNSIFELVTDSKLEPTAWIEHILSINAEEYKGCKQYYSNFDQKCGSCKSCPLSKVYENYNLDYECYVLQYMLQSKEKLNEMKMKLHQNQFRSIFDMAKLADGRTVPVYTHATGLLFDVIIECCNTLSFSEETDTENTSADKNHNNNNEAILSQNLLKKLKEECKSNGSAAALSGSIRGVSSLFVKEILMRKCNVVNIGSAISHIKKPNVTLRESDGAVYAEHSNMSISHIEEYKESAKEETCDVTDTIVSESFLKDFIHTSEPLPEPVQVMPNEVALDNDEPLTEMSEQSFENNTLPSVELSCEPLEMPEPAEKQIIYTEEVVVQEPIEDRKPLDSSGNILDDYEVEMNGETMKDADSPSCDEIKEATDDAETDGPDEPKNESATSPNSNPFDVTFHEIEISSLDEYPFDDSLVVIPGINQDELQEYCISLDKADARLLSMISNHLIPNNNSVRPRGSSFSIEFVSLADSRYLFLLYIPGLNAYFYTSFKNSDVKLLLSQALSYQSVTKYCYQPYMLVAQLRKHGIYTKNLNALFSLSEFLYPNHQMKYDVCMESMGAYDYEPRAGKARPTSNPIRYMHCYHRLYQLRYNDVVLSGLERTHTEAATFNLALGLSFLHKTKKGESSLFKLSSAGKYFFLANPDLTVLDNRKVRSVQFTYSPIPSSYVIRRLVNELYRTAAFKKGDVYILCLGVNFITYSIPLNMDKWFDGKIHSLLLHILMEERTRGLETRKVDIKPDEPLAPIGFEE